MKSKALPKPSKRAVIINGLAGLAIIAGAVTYTHQTFARPHFEVCSSRYGRQLSMVLDKDGAPLTPADVQAVANGLDEGTLENLSIGTFAQGPAKFAMGVKLAEGTAEARAKGQAAPGGVSLPWAPSTLEQPQSACLSYHVYLPADFSFGSGGTLPGLFGATLNGQFGDSPGFQLNPSWRTNGKPYFYLKNAQAGAEQREATVKGYEQSLPRGRWMRIDQELVLNTPKSPDGVARLWVDGKLEAEAKNLEMRGDFGVAVAGVSGDVYYGGSTTESRAPKDSVVWVSPFTVRWN